MHPTQPRVVHHSDLWEPRDDTPQPADCIKRQARVDTREGRRWIIYPDEIRRGKKTTHVIVEMPQDAPTKSCHEARHHQCSHRRGGPHEAGVWLKVTRPLFLWRCGCFCHSDPQRTGLLF